MIRKSHRDGLLRHSVLLLFATQFTNVANTLYTMVMGRVLSGEQYSIMLTMLKLILLVSTPLAAMRTAITHYTARFAQSDRVGDIPPLLRSWGKLTAIAVLPVGLAVLLAREHLAQVFHLPSTGPIITMGGVMVLTPFLPLFHGALHGLQSFRWMSGITTSLAVFRLLIGACLVLLVSATATQALVAQLVSVGLCIALAAWAVRREIGAIPPTGEAIPGSRLYFIRSCLVLASFTVLMNADMALVRHFLPDSAGIYAKASTIGRAIIFLPMPIAMAMFPKVTSHKVLTSGDRKTLRWSILGSAGVIGCAVLACMLLPDLALLILFGLREPGPELMTLVRVTVFAMSPIGLAFLLMNFELAQHRFTILPGSLLTACGYLVAVSLYHENLWQIVAILGAASFVQLLILVLALPRAMTAEKEDLMPPGNLAASPPQDAGDAGGGAADPASTESGR